MGKAADIVDMTVAGKYRLLELIDERAGALVYRARHQLIERYYAVTIAGETDAAENTDVRRFLADAAQACRLSQAHLLPVVDSGVLPDGRPYMVHELACGSRLSAEIAAGPLPLKRALKLFMDIVDAVAYLHDHGVVHGYIDSSNIIVLQKDGREFTKLIDCVIPRNTAVTPADDVAALARLMICLLGGPSQGQEKGPLRLPNSAPPWLMRTLEQAVSGDQRSLGDAAQLSRHLKGAIDLHEMATPTQAFPVFSPRLFPLPIVLSAGAIGILSLLFVVCMLHPELISKPRQPIPMNSAPAALKADEDSNLSVASDSNIPVAPAPSAEELYFSGKYRQAAAAYDREISTLQSRGAAPGCLALPYSRRGFCRMAIKQYALAVADYQRAVELHLKAGEDNIEMVNAYLGLAIANRNAGRQLESEVALKQAIAAKQKLKLSGDNRDPPAERTLRAGLANLYLEMHRTVDAKLQYQKILLDDPDDPVPPVLLVNSAASLAQILIAEGRVDEARAVLQRAQELSNQNPRMDAAAKQHLRTVVESLSSGPAVSRQLLPHHG